MELSLETLAQVIVFVVAFAATVVFLSDTDDGADRQSIMCGLRTLAKMIAGRMERPVQAPKREGHLSEETYRRLLYVHMTNAAPDQRIWFR
jgi:hypothetical protein